MIDVIHRLAISFLAGDLNPDWTHAALLGGSIAAEFAVAAGIVIESSWPKTWRQWLGIVLVIGGVIVGAAFTISLFVFDEAISQRQLDKIATLETEIAPRRLTADQEKTLAALFAKFPGQMVLFESYGKETEPFMLGMQILARLIHDSGRRIYVTYRE
jgi:hypothetical protein